MKLVDSTNTEHGVFVNIITHPFFILLAVCFIITLIFGLFTCKYTDEYSTLPELSIILSGIIIFLFMISMPVIFADSIPTVTYQGNAKVLKIEPEDGEGKQDITMKCDHETRKLSLYSDDIKNIKKGDTITIKKTYNVSKIFSPFYLDNNDNPKKHIKFKDMVGLNDSEIIKK